MVHKTKPKTAKRATGKSTRKHTTGKYTTGKTAVPKPIAVGEAVDKNGKLRPIYNIYVNGKLERAFNVAKALRQRYDKLKLNTAKTFNVQVSRGGKIFKYRVSRVPDHPHLIRVKQLVNKA